MSDVDQQAIRRILGGDRDAYGVLMERHFPTVFRITFRITGNHQDAEDAAQEAFLRAYDNLPEFRQTAGFGTWIYRIAMNCAFDLVRRRCRDTGWNAAPLVTEHGDERFAAPSLPGPQETLLDKEAAELRHRAMGQLTPMERTAFVLRHMEQKSINEIAAALGASPSSVKQSVFRAVGKLRRALRQEPQTVQPGVEEMR